MTNEIQPIDFNQDQVNLITRTIAKGASKDELMLFIGVCKRTGLDPFARQIFMLPRREWDKAANMMVTKQSIMASIDGLRLVAQRSREYEGQTPAQWCGDDGVWTDVWLKDTPPAAAKVSVHRTGFREPLTAVALYSAYVQTNKDGKAMARWGADPAGMLAKCAEALALRKAFPQELSGLYTNDEMNEDAPRKVAVEVTPDQLPPAPTTDSAAGTAEPTEPHVAPPDEGAAAESDAAPFTSPSEYMNRLADATTVEQVEKIEADILFGKDGLSETQARTLLAQAGAKKSMLTDR